MSFRKRVALDGKWQFQMDPAGGQDVAAIQHWREAGVPLPWQAQFDDLRHTSGVGWYRRTFTVESTVDSTGEGTGENVQNGSDSPALILSFGAVDYHATVWINGRRVGEHEGGYLPFEFDISAVVQAGANEVVVRVADPTDDTTRWPTYPFSEIGRAHV